MNITFLTEFGEKVGSGHLMRSLAIASAYREKGINPEIIVKSNKSSLPLFSDNYNINEFYWTTKFSQLIKKIEKTDFLIIDSISITKFFYSKLVSEKKNVLFI